MKYVVLDLEMCQTSTAMQKMYPCRMEIIQIGAVLLNENYEITDQFNSFVNPEFGQIDPFIHKLTGINQQDIENAPPLSEVLKSFRKWLPEGELTAVSWSLADENQLLSEIGAKGIENEGIFSAFLFWEDCQILFGDIVATKRNYSLSDALEAADISAKGKVHDGLSDAYNTAVLYAKLKRKGKNALNPYYRAAYTDKPNAGLSVSIGELFEGIKL